MKTKVSPKHLSLINTLLLLGIAFYGFAAIFQGCTTEQVKKSIESYGEDYVVIEIDSCEYIVLHNMPSRGVVGFAHKGNCKYCEARKHD